MKQTIFSNVLEKTRKYLLSERTTVPTGFQTLDQLMKGGISVGQVAMLLGRTEVGKTSLATNIAISALTNNHSTAFASLEMTAEEILLRTLSIFLEKADYEVEQLLKSQKPEPDVVSAIEKLKSLYIWEKGRPSWDQLLNWCQEIKKETGVSPNLVIIDHLKLMARYGYPRGEGERVQQLAEDCKNFAKETKAAVLIVHQVGRSIEEDPSKKNHGATPLSMEDAFYGGEQDADYILGAYRPERDPKLDVGQRKLVENKIYVQLLKNRHGESLTTGVECRWLKPTMKIQERWTDA